MDFKIEKAEKKVEYIELIYDLIFVYMIGRNNQLLHTFKNGFVDMNAFLAYVLCTLAIIQVWNFTTFYINMFGRNGVREHIFLFVNMYLLYFVGQSTRADWQAFQTQYHIAWGLILVNIGLQYCIELRNHKKKCWNRDIIIRMAATLFTESALVFIAAIPNETVGITFSTAAIFIGIILTAVSRRKSSGGQVDFMHLTERAMLFVVFTFGEMIIAVASYFTGDGTVDFNTIYFSVMAFLIVVGMFLSYGFIYDQLIDREGEYDGMLYMALHIFIIFFMNNITASLEYMREENIKLLPKILFLVISVVGYFSFLFSLNGYIKKCNKPTKSLLAVMTVMTAVFSALMILLREMMFLNIMITLIYVFGLFGMMYLKQRANIEEAD